MYFGMPVIGLGGTAVHNYDKNDKPSQLTGLWIDRWLQQLCRVHGFRISARAGWCSEIDTGLRKGVDSPYEDVWKISEDVRRTAVLHVEPDRDATPICAPMRAMPGTASRARRCRPRWRKRSSPAARRRCDESARGAATSSSSGRPRRRELRVNRGQANAQGARLGHAARRQRGPRAFTPKTCRRRGT